MLGALVGWALGVIQTLLGDYASVRLDTWVYAWMVVLLPSAVGGIAEDLTQRLAVRYRLALTAGSGVLALLLAGLDVPRTGLPWLDPWLPMVPWLSGF